MKSLKKIKPFFVDERGEMSHLIADDMQFTSAVLITSKKGSVRANHYHKKDTHYSYLIKGEMEYYYKDLNAPKEKPKKILIREGEVIHTPPHVLHAMKFTKRSIFIALTTEPRDQKKYERDTVRVKLI